MAAWCMANHPPRSTNKDQKAQSFIFAVLNVYMTFSLHIRATSGPWIEADGLHRDITLSDKSHHSSLRSFILWQAVQCSLLFHSAMCWDPHDLVQCTAVNIRFLLTIFKEGAGNDFPWLARHVISNKHIHCTLYRSLKVMWSNRSD